MIKLTPICSLMCIFSLAGGNLVAEPGKRPPNNRKLLSHHVTRATFVGFEEQKCRHLTALCPDRCTHGGTLAIFKITAYVDYKKPGKYGDPKQETFRVRVEDNQKNLKVAANILKLIKSMKKGDAVRLSWNHDYVTKEGASYPERSVTLLEKVVTEG